METVQLTITMEFLDEETLFENQAHCPNLLFPCLIQIIVVDCSLNGQGSAGNVKMAK